MNPNNKKMDDDDVRLARALYQIRLKCLREANNLTIAKLAEKFDVSETSMRDCVKGVTYASVL